MFSYLSARKHIIIVPCVTILLIFSAIVIVQAFSEASDSYDGAYDASSFTETALYDETYDSFSETIDIVPLEFNIVEPRLLHSRSLTRAETRSLFGFLGLSLVGSVWFDTDGNFAGLRVNEPYGTDTISVGSGHPFFRPNPHQNQSISTAVHGVDVYATHKKSDTNNIFSADFILGEHPVVVSVLHADENAGRSEIERIVSYLINNNPDFSAIAY